MDKIQYLTPLEVERLYRIPVASLATMRSRGGGPKYIKRRGSRVIYRDCDVREWLEAGLRESTSDAGTSESRHQKNAEPESFETCSRSKQVGQGGEK